MTRQWKQKPLGNLQKPGEVLRLPKVKEIDEIKDLAKVLRNEKLKGNWKNPYFSLSLTDLNFDLELVKV